MSVMECGREGCKSIMCDRLLRLPEMSSYICDSCYAELLEFKRDDWPALMSELELHRRITGFMNTPVGRHRIMDISEVDRKFRELTGELSAQAEALRQEEGESASPSKRHPGQLVQRGASPNGRYVIRR